MKANDTDNSRYELADAVLKQAQRDLQRFPSAFSAIDVRQSSAKSPTRKKGLGVVKDTFVSKGRCEP